MRKDPSPRRRCGDEPVGVVGSMLAFDFALGEDSNFEFEFASAEDSILGAGFALGEEKEEVKAGFASAISRRVVSRMTID